ncbi:MAG TPA: hypothetical protein VLF91_03080 [Candidatus Saccharimonadales bacterium]|nr:hypothetical protein [Candidatus Saccharimonadales bacterium]
MNITWKDGIATLLVGAAGLVVYAKEKGFKWPLLGNWRLASLALLAIGFATCIIVGWGVVPDKNGWTTAASIVGGLAFLAGLLGIVTNKELFFLSLAGSIIVLWALATIHHFVASP